MHEISCEKMVLQDDIICYGETYEECLSSFEKVIARLDTYGFRISLSKLSLFKKKLKILGVIITPEGIRSDPAKVESIKSFPIPNTKTELQRFLGMTNFVSDFCVNYSLISSPLYKLTSSTSDKVTLGKEELDAFNKLKLMISRPTILNFIDDKKPVYIEVDAAKNGYGGLAYQIEEYDISDLPRLQAEQERICQKTQSEIDSELQDIIDKYTQNMEVPSYEPMVSPQSGTQTEEQYLKSPFLNSELKIKRKGKKLYVPRVNFFVSKKFTESQSRCWSSLFKEMTSILDFIEKRAEFLSLAKETIVLSDCSACTYLYHQSKSNSLLSRYLSRLNMYPFRILVRHKSGEKLTAADTLSRLYIIDSDEYNSKISHHQGILVKVPFRLGQVVTPIDIMDELAKGDDQIVMANSDPRVTKDIQTNNSSILNSDKQTVIERVNQIQSFQSKVYEEIEKDLTIDNYIKFQKEDFPDLYQKLLTTTVPNHKLVDGIILIKHKDDFVRLTPKSLRNKIISRTHLLGHYASRRMIKNIQATDFWPSMRRDIETFTSTCLSCLWLRPSRGQYKLGHPLQGKTGEVLFVDVVSGLPNAFGYSFFCSVVCSFSRFLICFPLRKDTSMEIAKNLEEKVFGVFGSPRFLISDGATNLNKSNRIQELCRLYQVSLKVRSPYSSRSMGIVERIHRSVLDNLRSLTASFENKWPENLALASAVYNSSPHTGTKLSPFEIMFGRKNPIWDPIKKPSVKLRNPDLEKYHANLRRELEGINKKAKQNDELYKKQMHKKFGGHEKEFPVGSFVITQNKMPAVNEKIKMRPKYFGPFLVHQALDRVLVAENIISKKVSYLNKNLTRLLPEKSIETFKDLPAYAKRIFGEGYDFETWKELHNKDKLSGLLAQRNSTELEYGIEAPFDRFIPNLETPEELKEPAPIQETPKDDTSSSSENEIEAEAPIPTQTKRVTFQEPQLRQSTRTRRAPLRLDL